MSTQLFPDMPDAVREWLEGLTGQSLTQVYEPAPQDVAHAVATLASSQPAPVSQPAVTIAGVPQVVRDRYVELVNENGASTLPWRVKGGGPCRFKYAKQAIAEYHKTTEFASQFPWHTRPYRTEVYDPMIEKLKAVAVLPAREDVQIIPPTRANTSQASAAQEAAQNWLQRQAQRNAENLARHVPVTAAVAPVRVVMPASGFPIARTNDTGQAWCECGGLRSKDTSVPCHNVHKDCQYAVKKGEPYTIVKLTGEPAPTQEELLANVDAIAEEIAPPAPAPTQATTIRLTTAQMISLAQAGAIPAGAVIEITD